MEESGSSCRSEAEAVIDDRNNSSILLVGGSVTLRVGSGGASHDWEADRQRHLHHDSDTRSQCSQKSDLGYNSAGGGGVDNPLSSMRSVGSVGSHGSGDYRGLSLHGGHAHFGHTVSVGAAHLLNGDATHQFPPSMYHASVDAPKSDAATVCSSSVFEDIEVESHVSGEGGHTNTKDNLSSGISTKSHPSPPSSVKMTPTGLRRSNSAEGNRLVDFADRSQVALASVIPQHGRQHGGFDVATSAHRAASTTETMSIATSGTGFMDEDIDMSSMHNSTGRAAGMGPPLSRTWLLQQQNGGSPSRPGSVKSYESNNGSDLVAHVGSDCGGSLTDAQSILSQEDALMAATSESGELSSMAKVAIASEDGHHAASKHDDNDDECRPHPLLCSQPDSLNGRTSPGGTIYRGRGIRRYKGRFMHLPLKRFHQNGIHLSSVRETGQDSGHPMADYDDRWQIRGYSALEDEYQRDTHNYYRSSRQDPNVRSRSRSRSRSPSPPTAAASRESKNGYDRTNVGRKNRFHSSKPGRGYEVPPLNGHNGFIDDINIGSSLSEKLPAREDPRNDDDLK